jgi:ADP-heptose:LPS heptosyltransferase
MTKRVRRVAVVKPDHLGDLILSLPNLDFLTSTAEQMHLFVAPAMTKIARQLLPHVEVFPIELPHLSKTHIEQSTTDVPCLRDYDLLLLLRFDEVLDLRWCQLHNKYSFCVGNDNNVHETFGQADKIADIFGRYLLRPFGPLAPTRYPPQIKRVGLSIGSGFPTNIWPWVNWVELSRKIRDLGIEVVLIGGPTEERMLPVLANLMALPRDNILFGSDDIESFLRVVQTLDVVIASDGGTGHLCSLATAVISLQTSGDWRRFSPFGKVHRTLTRDLQCSPCKNFLYQSINLCASRECAYLLLPDHVIEALFCPYSRPGTTITFGEVPQVCLNFGASHLGRINWQPQSWQLFG